MSIRSGRRGSYLICAMVILLTPRALRSEYQNVPVCRQTGELTEQIPAVISEGCLDLRGVWRYKPVLVVTTDLTNLDLDDSAWAVTIAPAEWEEKSIGISAWFNLSNSAVYLNGQKSSRVGIPCFL